VSTTYATCGKKSDFSLSQAGGQPSSSQMFAATSGATFFVQFGSFAGVSMTILSGVLTRDLDLDLDFVSS
jgi:hypothetical protein